MDNQQHILAKFQPTKKPDEPLNAQRKQLFRMNC